MKIKKNTLPEIVKMQVCDIAPILKISSETKLEDWTYNDLAAELECRNAITLVAKFKEHTVGFCVARLIMNLPIQLDLDGNLSTNFNSKSECEIYNIGIDREFQRRGIGKCLLKQLMFLINKSNAESIWLEVRESNVQAINFYQKNDFMRLSIRKNFYSNPVENALVMKRELNAKPIYKINF